MHIIIEKLTLLVQQRIFKCHNGLKQSSEYYIKPFDQSQGEHGA